MDFLTQLALPQSVEHFHLVILLATLSAIVFLPYMAVAIGTAVLSQYLSSSGREDGNAAAIQLARALAETTFASKSLITYLGVIPGLSLVFSLAQIVQRTSSAAVAVAAVGFVFLTGGLFLMYAYRYTFRVQGLLEAYDVLVRRHNGDIAGDVDTYRSSNLRSHILFGRYGTMFLFIAAFFYVASLSLAIDPALWTEVTSFLGVFITLTTWLRYAVFLAFSIGLAGAGLLFIAFHWKKEELGEDEMSVQLARRYGFILSVAGLVALPVTILAQLNHLPPSALSGSVFGMIGFGLMLFFVSAHFIYAFFRNNTATSSAYAFFFYLVAGTVLVTSDFTALGSSTRHQAEVLAVAHTVATDALKASLGIAQPSRTGEDIFNSVCSACHLFDQKKVGPPYKQTIPKYKDKKGDLVAFIMNPVKIDPAYPNMPNQGLKPMEADSIATYLLQKVLTTAQ